MSRINGEDIEALVLEVFDDLDDDEVKLANLYEALRKKRWDIDDNDIRSAMSKLFADRSIVLTFDRHLKRVIPD